MDKDSVRLRKLGLPWGPELIEAVKVASLKLAEVRAPSLCEANNTHSTLRWNTSYAHLVAEVIHAQTCAELSEG